MTSAPEGYESTHGIVSTGSRFADSEFVIYNISQCRLRYVLEIHDEKLDGPLRQLEMTSHFETIKTENNKMEVDEEEINELKGKKFSFFMATSVRNLLIIRIQLIPFIS